jgi:hypothetical protein
VPLIHFCYPIIFFIITYSCIDLILMGPNRSPSLFIHFTFLSMNHLGSFANCFTWFWDNISLYPCSNYFVILSMFMSRPLMLIGTWSLTWETRATTRVEWDALGWLIRKASGRLPYPKGARVVGELHARRFLGWFCCDGGQMRDSCKCSSHKL